MRQFHEPVLLQEVITYLQPGRGKKFVDATLGGGGHTFQILERGGEVLGIDVDQDAIDFIERKFKTEEHLRVIRGNFKDISKIARSNRFEDVAGVLFDLGVSSYQLDTPERGFSFQEDSILDMRMDRSLSVKAVDLINGLTKGELYELFSKLGEEHYARTISSNIIRSRGLKKIESTKELADIIVEAVGAKKDKIHPATKVFQALRIAVNDELHNLQDGLRGAIEIIAKNGILVVISFHSLEDRIVKNTFKEFEEGGKGLILTKKPVEAKDEEMKKNRKSRSAKLRAFQRL